MGVDDEVFRGDERVGLVWCPGVLAAGVLAARGGEPVGVTSRTDGVTAVRGGVGAAAAAGGGRLGGEPAELWSRPAGPAGGGSTPVARGVTGAAPGRGDGPADPSVGRLSGQVRFSTNHFVSRLRSKSMPNSTASCRWPSVWTRMTAVDSSGHRSKSSRSPICMWASTGRHGVKDHACVLVRTHAHNGDSRANFVSSESSAEGRVDGLTGTIRREVSTPVRVMWKYAARFARNSSKRSSMSPASRHPRLFGSAHLGCFGLFGPPNGPPI